MSILINGMTMPKNCEECKLRNGMGKDDGKAIYHCAPTIIESTIGQLNSDSAVNEAEEGE